MLIALTDSPPWPKSEPDHQQRNDLGNDYGGKDAQAEQFLQQPLIRQHFGHQAQAGQRQDCRQRERLGEFQLDYFLRSLVPTQLDSPVEQVRGNHQSHQDGNNHRDGSSHEIPASDSGHESGNVYLVQANQEKENKDADVQEDLDVLGYLDQSGQRAKDDSGHGIGNDGIQPHSAEDAFDQLGHHD